MTEDLIKYNKSAQIADGEDTSNAVDLEDRLVVGIFVPETFDGDSLTILVGRGGSEFVPAGDGTEEDADITLSVSDNGRYVPLPQPTLGLGWRHIKLKSSDPQSGSAASFDLATISR